jgi:hypothetical protein
MAAAGRRGYWRKRRRLTHALGGKMPLLRGLLLFLEGGEPVDPAARICALVASSLATLAADLE